jgi:hypothetical protein
MVCLSHASRSSCFQLFRSCDRLTRPLCSSPITAPSSLIRVGPPQCSASVLLPRGFGRLGFSFSIGDWFLQFRAIACIRFTPSLRPVATCSVTRHPADLSQKKWTPLVSTTPEFITTRHQKVHSRSSLGRLPAQVFLMLFLQRSQPRLLTAAAWRWFEICS